MKGGASHCEDKIRLINQSQFADRINFMNNGATHSADEAESTIPKKEAD
jgi:hypothetical protein